MNSVLLLATILLSVDAAVPASAPAAVSSAPAVVSAATDAGVPASDAVVASVSDAQVITVTPSAAPVSAAASVPAEPATVEQAVGQVTVLVDLFKAGKWLAFALVLVQLLMFGIKKFASDEFKKAWGFVVVTGLGGVVALLSAVVAGGTWLEALFVFASGPVSALVYDLIRAVKPKKA
jgi:hypothetical protein